MNPKETITQSRNQKDNYKKGKEDSIIPNADLSMVPIIIKDQIRFLLFLQSNNFNILYYYCYYWLDT